MSPRLISVPLRQMCDYKSHSSSSATHDPSAPKWILSLGGRHVTVHNPLDAFCPTRLAVTFYSPDSYQKSTVLWHALTLWAHVWRTGRHSKVFLAKSFDKSEGRLSSSTSQLSSFFSTLLWKKYSGLFSRW